jgi:hypothetical protein
MQFICHPSIPSSANPRQAGQLANLFNVLQPQFPNVVPWKAKFHESKQRFRYKSTLRYETITITNDGVGLRCRYNDSLRAGRSGDRIHLVGEIFRTRPDRSWGPSRHQYNVRRISFHWVKRPGRGVDHPPIQSPRLKKE